MEQAVSLWEEMARPYEAAEALLDLARLAGEQESDAGRAMSAARRALALARRHKFVALEAAALLALAKAYDAMGEANGRKVTSWKRRLSRNASRTRAFDDRSIDSGRNFGRE